MPRTTPLTTEEVKTRMSDLRTRWLRERRLLERKHGERWHGILNSQKLERIESKGLVLTRQLDVHPDWWTLPCECKACAEETSG